MRVLEQEAITFQGYYELILTYVDTYQPSVKETFEFIGTLIYSVIDMVDITEHEKQAYLNMYNKLIIQKIKEKKQNDSLAIL